MNNNADFLARGHKEVCELSSESDSDSDSFYLVGGQSDYDSDSFIVVGEECDAEMVQDIKFEHLHVDEESSEVNSEINKEVPQQQIDTEYANIYKDINTDENVASENVQDRTSTAEEDLGQTSLIHIINNHKNKFAQEEEECTDGEEDFTNEEKFSDDEEKEQATAAVKHNEVESDQFCKNILNKETQVTEIDLAENSPVVPAEKQETAFPATESREDNSIKFCEDMDNNETKMKESDLVDSYLVPERNIIVGKENVHVDDQCSETNNIKIEENCSDEEECTDEEGECSDEEEECTDEGVEFSDDEENEPATATTKLNEVESDQFCKDIENSETNATEINLEESNSVISVASNRVDNEIKQLEDDRCSVNDKERLYTDDEEEYTDDEECTGTEEESSDEEDQLTDNEEQELATATVKHNKDGSQQSCNDIVTKTTQINLERSSPIVPEKNNSSYKEIEKVERGCCNNATKNIKQSEDRSDEICENIVNKEINIKEISLVESNLIVPEAHKSIDRENDHSNETNSINIEGECTAEEDECTDEEEESTDKEEKSSDEEETVTATTKLNEVESDQFCKDIVNSETNATEINLEESNSVIPVASNRVDNEIKQLEDDRRSVTDNVNDKERLSTDDEEEYTDEEEESSDEEDQLTDNEEQELAIATAKHNKDGSQQSCNDIINRETKTTQINLERSSPIVPEKNNSIYKEIEKVEGGRCNNATENIKQSEDRFDEICEDIVNKEISLVESNSIVPEAHKCIDIENDRSNETNNIHIEAECTDEEEECSDEEEEFTDEEETVKTTTKLNEVESDQFCKDIVNSETNTMEIKLEESNSVIPVASNRVDNEIKQLEDDRYSVTDNVNDKERLYTDDEEEYTDEEEECTDTEEESSDEEDELTDNEEQELATDKSVKKEVSHVV